MRKRVDENYKWRNLTIIDKDPELIAYLKLKPFYEDARCYRKAVLIRRDVAIDIMKNEDWGGLFLTFGAIDKFGHMLGDVDRVMPRTFSTPASLDEVTKIADKQLGRLLDELQSKKLLERTLIVITADHGGQSNFFPNHDSDGEYLFMDIDSGNVCTQCFHGLLLHVSGGFPREKRVSRMYKICPTRLSPHTTVL